MSIESFFFGIVLGLAAGIAIAIPATAFFFKEIVRQSLKCAARYKAALDILCRQYGEAVDCVDCQYSCSCRLVPKDGEQSKNLCGEIIKRVIEDRVKKAGVE